MAPRRSTRRAPSSRAAPPPPPPPTTTTTTTTTTTRRRKGKRPAKKRDDVADAIPSGFRELLEEDRRRTGAPSSSSSSMRVPPHKRRRVQDVPDVEPDVELDELQEYVQEPALENAKAKGRGAPEVQTVTLSSDEEGEEENWEEVDLGQDVALADEVENGDLEIVLGGQETTTTTTLRRKRARRPATIEERRMRLTLHKIHIVCLLYHGFLRNHWCNDKSLQKKLRDTRIVPSKVILKLHPDTSAIQLQRSRIFKEGLTAVLDAWRLNFRVTGHGIRRPLWPTSPQEARAVFEGARDTESFVDLTEFRRHALDFEGSADYGAQLFCALLRGLEVQARLVFSLQPLGFDARGAGPLVNEELRSAMQVEPPSQITHTAGNTDTNSVTPQRISRLGRTDGTVPTPQTSSVRKQRSSTPRHAIFWVEAFDEAYQKWIALDPSITGTLGKASVFEPALNDAENVMTYVFAYEASGAARDVTVRYAKAFTAKTRKFRVESTEGGAKWLRRATKPFRRRGPGLDRDAIEDAQLLQREAAEGMPKNIEDFKDHPVYVLERHLRRHEVLHPKHKVGQMAQRGGASSAAELVYRRKDVHDLKSGDRWFRTGRQVKTGEVPLKRISRKRKHVDGADDEIETVALYAIFQTELYVPEPVVHGRVPRNGFRNLDVYVPSMIPPGGVHIKSAYAKAAARLIAVDAVDAVTGFDFRGRHGTARIDGVIVASEFKDAVVAVAEGLAMEDRMTKEKKMVKEERKRKRRIALEKRIRARVRREYGSEDDGEDSYDDDEESEEESEDEEGNFTSLMFEDGGDERVVVVESTAKLPAIQKSKRAKAVLLTKEEEMELFGRSQESRHQLDADLEDFGGGFILDDDEQAGGFVLDKTIEQSVSRPDSITDPDDKKPSIHDADMDKFEGGFIFENEPANTTISPPMERQDPDQSSSAAHSPKKPQKRLPETLLRGVDSDGLDGSGSRSRYKRAASTDSVDSAGSMLSHDPEDEDADPDWLD